ncbi:amidophosphoribosyltransferase [Nitriliruptoraceae bacterium ZYF776]|nr:amidophosphoribosyltransferase [Profundirhabdus halotolerans]
MPDDVDLAALAEGPREECGVFGIYAPGEDVSRATYFALYALQHRGQEAAGIAVSDGRRIVVHKDTGLVNQVFTDTGLAALQGDLAVGHCRYSTTGGSTWVNAQPQYRETPTGGGLALGHNGNLVNTAELARELDRTPGNDSEVMAALLAREVVSYDATGGDDGSLAIAGSLEEAIVRVAPRLRGAYSVVVMDEDRLYGFRDPNGVRPLQIGRLPAGGWVLSSETAGLDIVGAVYVRDVAPGELVTIDARGLRSRRFAPATPTFCLFEWVYLARPDHRQDGGSVLFARRQMGRVLAQEAPVDADLVIPVPEAGRDAAAGYAAEAGLPFADGLVKNRYVGRTFIQPSQSLRQLGIRLKLSPVREVVEGKRLVVVDDSIVRGNTSRQLVQMLYAAGAAEVHLRITSPPIAHPCYYGIDMATRAELIGADLAIEEIRAFVGCDSLHYISLDGLVSATPHQRKQLCTACFSGEYPIPVPGEHEQLAQIKFDFGADGEVATDGEAAAERAAPAHVPPALERERVEQAREGRTVE